MAPKQWISIRNIIIYLETKFCPNRRIFVFLWPFWIQNGRHMVEHVLLPVSIHFHWKIYFCVKFQKDPLYGMNSTYFAPWLPWQRPPFWIFSNSQKLPHTTVDNPAKFHEVWWNESKNFLNPPFLFPWQLRQSLSNRFRFLWLISFH
jgi:hypothetical protein